MILFRGMVILVALALVGFQVQFSSALGLNEPCVNPKQQPGRCVSLAECPSLAAILKKNSTDAANRTFLQKSQCGVGSKGKILVCCAGAAPIPASNILPGTEECGLDLADRIVGGQETGIGEFPWLALLQYRKLADGTTGYHCGGTLINVRYVLTAAHCFLPELFEVTTVRLGEHDIDNHGQDCNKLGCAEDPEDYGVEKIKIHEKYQPNSINNLHDIALIRVNRDVEYTDYIQPICLPVSSAAKNLGLTGKKLTAAGWGRTETNNPSSVKLKVKLEVENSDDCFAIYATQNVILKDTQLCAGGLAGKDTCSGDSGGPLMQKTGVNYFQYGIVSFGPNKCGLAGVPGVYTNVPKYIDWIQKNLE
ncbi:CLIP domain-containing serine protease B4-like [Uranotaenia lowii]|uniref:CLIP domain-containing serine protease B4-like n=1 Tax=Uranotaenia lowii TaxID=190385 RepID=UPI00247A1179|nr:CLIP domain-containing serine protease B4-like [Uranotaenia lowii]